VTKMMVMIKDNDKLKVIASGGITHTMVDGKIGQISFSKGVTNEIIKRKDGILQVNSV